MRPLALIPFLLLCACASAPEKHPAQFEEEPWLVCIRAAVSLECVASVNGNTQRISIPDEPAADEVFEPTPEEPGT